MRSILRKIFLNDAVIFGIILFNAIVIYLQVDGYEAPWLAIADHTCTVLFLIEMIVKLSTWGSRTYFADGWNRMDATLVLLSVPSLLAVLTPNVLCEQLSVLLVMRLLRVLKFFRMLRFFPNFAAVMRGFSRAMSQTWGVLAAFVVLLFVFSLVSCSLFRDTTPEYFGSPLTAFYTLFRMFTIEGWYEIPDAVAANMAAPWLASAVRAGFCLLLIAGGIIGMSFINSIFVDAMVEDNNDEIKAQLDRIEKQLNELMHQHPND